MGASNGIRVLSDGSGGQVVVDRAMDNQRQLAEFRRRSVDDPILVVFREPVPADQAAALDDQFDSHLRWGPVGSVGAVHPADGQRFRVVETTWVVHRRSWRLVVRWVAEAVDTPTTVPPPGR